MATRSASSINPRLPVAKSEFIFDNGIVFDITKISNFVSPTYGPTWRVFCVNIATGEAFLMLNAANSVRDDEMAGYREATDDGDHVGPCKLDKIPRKNGQFAWNIIDAEPADVARAKSANTPAIPHDADAETEAAPAKK